MKSSYHRPPTRRSALIGAGAMGLAACTGIGTQSGKAHDSKADASPKPGWRAGTPLPLPRQEIYPCAHNGAIRLAGGFLSEAGRITGPSTGHLIYQPGNKEWLSTNRLPTARHHPHLISFDGSLLAFAGFEAPSAEAGWTMRETGWRYSNVRLPGPDGAASPEGEFWRAIKPLPAPCAEAVVGVTGDNVLHLAGGRTPKGSANGTWRDHVDTDHHFVLTGLGRRWMRAAPCPTKRNSAAGGTIDGNLHIVGGRVVGGGNVATHEVYDYREDRWRTAAPLPQAQGGLAAAVVAGKLYVFGGEFFDNGGGVYKEAWVYDPAHDVWAALPDMPHPRHGLGAVTLDGDIYVIGGALEASGNATSAIVDIYRPGP